MNHNKDVAEAEAMLIVQGLHAAVREAHMLLDREGIPSAGRVACDDPDCDTQLGHRLREFIRRTRLTPA